MGKVTATETGCPVLLEYLMLLCETVARQWAMSPNFAKVARETSGDSSLICSCLRIFYIPDQKHMRSTGLFFCFFSKRRDTLYLPAKLEGKVMCRFRMELVSNIELICE